MAATALFPVTWVVAAVAGRDTIGKKLAAGDKEVAEGKQKVKAGEEQLASGKEQLARGMRRLNEAKGIRTACGFGTILFTALFLVLGYRWRRSLYRWR